MRHSREGQIIVFRYVIDNYYKYQNPLKSCDLVLDYLCHNTSNTKLLYYNLVILCFKDKWHYLYELRFYIDYLCHNTSNTKLLYYNLVILCFKDKWHYLYEPRFNIDYQNHVLHLLNSR